jgi:hypothetical protein
MMRAPGLGGVPPEQLLAARRSAHFLLTLADYGVIDPVLLAKLDALLDGITAEIRDRAQRKYPDPPGIQPVPPPPAAPPDGR